MPPALTRAASTGVAPSSVAIDIDDSSTVPVESCCSGAALGAHWADWSPTSVDELLGRGSAKPRQPSTSRPARPRLVHANWRGSVLRRDAALTTEFGAFCDAVHRTSTRSASPSLWPPATRGARRPTRSTRRDARAFKAIDLDDSGQIDLDELVTSARPSARWTRAACESLLGKMDADEDSKISFAEFDAFIRNVGLHGAAEVAFVRAGEARRSLAEPYSEATVRRAFKAADLDDSGQIDLDELLAFGQAVGQEWTRAACQSLLGKMDKDGDQLVSFAEFDGFLREVGLHGDKGAVAAFLEAGEERRRSVGAADEEDETGASQEV